jgi:hypothetical protein
VHSISFIPSNQFLQSTLLPTLHFLSEKNDDDKASVASVTLRSGAASGGAFLALIGLFCLWLFLYRRDKVVEEDDEVMDEFDLPAERNEEEESYDEDESLFDMNREDEDEAEVEGDGMNPEDFAVDDHWVSDNFHMDFDEAGSFLFPHTG